MTFGFKARLLQGFDHELSPLFPRLPNSVNDERLGDGPKDIEAGIQGFVGILENHLEVAAEREQRSTIQRGEVHQPGPDLAAILAPLLPDHDSTLGRRLEAGDQTARGGLAAPAFTYEAENLAPTEIKGDPVHRANVDSVAAEGLEKASSELEVLLQALDVDDDVLV